MKKAILLLFFFTGLESVAQQKTINHQSAIWTRAIIRLQFNKQLYFTAEFDERFFPSNFSQMQFVQRSILGWQFNKRFDAALCHAFFLNKSNSPDKPGKFPVPELRPHQDFFIRQYPSEKVTLWHRFRFEERFFHNFNSMELTPGYFFVFRARYQFSVFYNFWKNEKGRELTAIFFEETFFQFGKTIQRNFDQQRFSAGLRFNLNRKTGFSLAYMNQLQQPQTGNILIDRHNILITWFQNIDFSKKEN